MTLELGLGAAGSGLVGMVGVSIGSWVLTCVSEYPHKYVCVLAKLGLSVWRLNFRSFLKQKVGNEINMPNVSQKRRHDCVFNST